MAIIAKLITYDGGMAYTENSVRLKKPESGVNRAIDFADITAVRMRSPRAGQEGAINIQIAGERTADDNTLFFEEYDLDEAVRFRNKLQAAIDSYNHMPQSVQPAPAAPPQPVRRPSKNRSVSPGPAPARAARKKPLVRRWWFWAILAVLVIGTVGNLAGGNTDDAADGQAPAPAGTPASAAPADDTGAADPASTASSADGASIDSICGLLDTALAQNFDHYEISSSDNIITINIWEDGLAAELAVIQASGGDENHSDWASFKQNMTSMAKSFCDLAAGAGRDDVNINVNILNDLNRDNTLISMLNTYVVYDVLADG